jgi:hypothetical protein
MAVFVPRGDTKMPQQQHGGEHGQHLVLALHEHHGAEVDLVADVLHLAVAVVVADQHVVDDEGDQQADHAEDGRVEEVVKQHDLLSFLWG